MNHKQTLLAAGMIAAVLTVPLIAGCSQRAEAQKLEVTYYYLPT